MNEISTRSMKINRFRSYLNTEKLLTFWNIDSSVPHVLRLESSDMQHQVLQIPVNKNQ